jgi:hypothetical protein
MSIIYGMIAKSNGLTLAHFAQQKGNFQEVARALVRKMPPTGKNSWDSKEYSFFGVSEEGLVSLAMVETATKKERVMKFLNDMLKGFKEKFSSDQIYKAAAFGLKYDDEIRMLINRYNNSADMNSSSEAMKAAMKLKDITIENLSEILDNNNKLDMLLEKTKAEVEITGVYVRDAKKLKCEMLKRKILYSLGIFIAVIVIALIIASIVCRGITFPKCRK